MLVLTIAMMLSPDSTWAQAEVHLEVRGRADDRMVLGLGAFTVGPKDRMWAASASSVADILAVDLTRTRLFDLMDRYAIGDAPMRASGELDLWASAGARALVRGEIRGRGERVGIRATVFDLSFRRLIFAREYEGNPQDLRSITHRIADDIVGVLTGVEGTASTRIAFVSTASQYKEVYVMDADGDGPERITRDASIAMTPCWSPDGRRIVYTSHNRGNWNLYMIDLETRDVRPLSERPGIDAGAVWSPDGSRIAFMLSERGNTDIYTIRPDGTDLRRLTRHPGIDASPSWSPDGRRIVFSSDRGGVPQLYVMDADGTSLHKLSWTDGYEDSPTWSPKGDRIAFVARTETGFDVCVVDPAGENPVRLTTDSGSYEDPSWSPDGRHIVFSSTRNGTSQIYRMDRDGSNQRALTSRGQNVSPAWSPRLEP